METTDSLNCDIPTTTPKKIICYYSFVLCLLQNFCFHTEAFSNLHIPLLGYWLKSGLPSISYLYFMKIFDFLFRSLLLLLLALLLGSCSNELKQNLQATPTAFGKINSLTILADSSLWNSGFSDSITAYFGAPYIILPQPEPLFDLRQIEPYRLASEPSWQQLRSYLVLADLSDKNSPTTRMVLEDLGEEKILQVNREGFGTAIGNNKWAKGQQLVYLLGKNETELRAGIQAAHPAVIRRLKTREADRVNATAYFDGENREIQSKIESRTGAQIRIPKSYVMAPIPDTSITWLRKMVSEGSLNILLTKVPYENQEQLTKEGLKILRDRLGKEYISSSTPGTYMRINDNDLPLFTEITEVNGYYAIEGRGIWEMENAYMAGPFVSYLLHNPSQKELLFLDGFVFAPGHKKRDMMEELNYVLRTINF